MSALHSDDGGQLDEGGFISFWNTSVAIAGEEGGAEGVDRSKARMALQDWVRFLRVIELVPSLVSPLDIVEVFDEALARGMRKLRAEQDDATVKNSKQTEQTEETDAGICKESAADNEQQTESGRLENSERTKYTTSQSGALLDATIGLEGFRYAAVRRL